MSAKDLSKFIDILRQNGELVEVNQHVDPELEITEIVDRLSKHQHYNKAILFSNTGKTFPVLINAFGSPKRMSLALGENHLDDLGQRVEQVLNLFLEPPKGWQTKLKMLPQLYRLSKWFPKKVSGRGKCQEIVMSEPNLWQLPILKCWPNDGGQFITLPCVHTISPVTSHRNLGMYRMQVFDTRTTGMHWHPHKTGARHYEEYKKVGKVMPVTVTLGGDPVYTFAATAPLPENIDEYLLAGFIREQGVRLVKCLTNDLWIPEDVDIVIEGYVDPSEPLVEEGPFGDHTGFYSLTDLYPQFHITAITHRRQAIFPATIVGVPPMEDAYIAEATERIFMPIIKKSLAPEITDMHLPIWGVAHNLVLISMRTSYSGQGFKVAQSFWGAGQMMFNKVMIIFDEEVNLRDYRSLLAILSDCFVDFTRLLFSKGPLDVLDHSADTMGFGGKLCIDLTQAAKSPGKTEIQFLFANEGENLMHQENSLSENVTLISIILEPETQRLSNELKVWYVLSNIDPLRDISVVENGGSCQILVDGRRKTKNLRWPNVITMSDEIIERVDARWNELFSIDCIVSPSLAIKPLKVGNGVEIEK
ncbi:MAG TPA: menaquinone biosynthesis decarboxylase [Salinivirgaceae bacterium]|nr:menaquinone biosynthesis decarboxylase [Salinivirgaceae bacterium]